MADNHNNEPRDVGLNKEFTPFLKEWISKDSGTIFSGSTMADIFFFGVALGKFRNKKSDVKNRAPNIPVTAFTEEMKWSVLSQSISQTDLLILKDEKPIYAEAEKYANEGIQILKSRIDKEGMAFAQKLEIELREILNKNKS